MTSDIEKLSFKNPYVFFSDGIGDCFFNLPALRALTDIFNGDLTLICTNGLGNIFFKDLAFRKIIEIPSVVNPNKRKDAMEICKREIINCDLFIYINPYYFPEILELINYLAPDVAMGYFEEFKIQIEQDIDKHSMVSHFKFPKYFNNKLDISQYVFPPTIGFSDGDIVRRIIDSIPSDTKLIIVHPDTTKEFKTWAYSNYNTLFDEILTEHPHYIIMIVGISVLEYKNCKHADRIFSATDLPLEISLDIIKYAHFFIGIDSCFLHAADFFRIPSIGIFANEYFSIRYGLALTAHRHVFSEKADINLISPEDIYTSFNLLSKELI